MVQCRVRILVSGKVQGVFFRQAMKAEAKKTGVCGFVRNLDDGRVEAVVEGTADTTNHMADWCRKGPAGARVRATEVANEEPTGEFADFDVLY